MDLCSLWHTADVTPVCLRVTLDFPFHLVSQAASLASAPQETKTSASSPSVLQRFCRFSQGVKKVLLDQKPGTSVLGFSLCRVKVIVRMHSPSRRNQSLFLFFLYLVTNLVFEMSQRLQSNSGSPASRLQCVTERCNSFKPRRRWLNVCLRWSCRW